MSFANSGWGAPLPVNLDGTITDSFVTLDTDQEITGTKTFDANKVLYSGAGYAINQNSGGLRIGDAATTNPGTFQFIAARDDLLIQTNSTDRLILPKAGFGLDSTASRFLVTNGAGFTTLAQRAPLPLTSVVNDIATYSDTTGTLKDSGVSITSLVTGPASATSANIATYNGTTGKIIQDSGVATTNIPNQLVNTTSSPTFATQTLTTGLLLPTTGGTPATLNFYEVYQGTHTWSGIWASSITANVTYIRIGNMVTVTFQRAYTTATTASLITSDAIPARFRPSATGSNATGWPAYPLSGITNNAGTTPYIYYNPTGTKWQIVESITKLISGANWVGSGASGIFESGFTYWV